MPLRRAGCHEGQQGARSCVVLPARRLPRLCTACIWATAPPAPNPTRPRAQPMVSCEPSEDPSTYTGYVIELFRLLAHELGWREGADWVMRCMPFSDMLSNVLDPDGSCTIAAAGARAQGAGRRQAWPSLLLVV